MVTFKNAFISVVATAPEFGSAEYTWLQNVHASINQELTDYEILVITSDSAGLKEQGLTSLPASLCCVRVIVLTHAVNHDVGTLAGLENAIGDYTVAVSATQHTPEQIIAVLTQASSGSDVVFGTSEAGYGCGLKTALKILGALGPSRGPRRLAPDYLDGLVCLNRQTLNQLLATGRLQHGLFDRMAKVATCITTLDTSLTSQPHAHHLSRAGIIRSALLSLVMDSTRLVRRAAFVSFVSFAIARLLPLIGLRSSIHLIPAVFELVAYGALLTTVWIIAEYTYRSLEKDGQMHPYIIREELQSCVMNPLLKTNVVSESH